jgi:peroxiredoxin
MRTSKIISVIIISITLFSCKENDKKEKQLASEKIEILEPNIDFNELEADFTKWWTYYSYNISLSSNFIGLNEKSDTIAKKQFLEKLITGNYIPLKIKSNTEMKTYKLFELDGNANKDISKTIKNESLTSLKHLNMEGQGLPKFELVDLNGNHYTNENTKGKTIILKTWFINCKACVAEFPELNEFVEKYKQRDDIIFVSLALDTKNKLESFLQKKDFEYKVVPNQKGFIEKLNLQIYPTHLVVDENGTITKVVNKASEMIAFFESKKEKQSPEKATPPPPPPPM